MTHHTPFSIAGLCCFWQASLTLYWQSEWLERMSTQLSWRGLFVKARTSPPLPDSFFLQRCKRCRNICAPHAYVFFQHLVILDQFEGALWEFWLLCKWLMNEYFHFHVVVNDRRGFTHLSFEGAPVVVLLQLTPCVRKDINYDLN